MAAGILPKPGEDNGPCDYECQHRDCVLTRAMAKYVCRYCGKVIGYGEPFYQDQDREQKKIMGLIHAVCLERHITQKEG